VPLWLKRLLLVFAAFGILALIVYAFLPKPVDVDLATPERGPLRVTVDEEGKTRIKERYVVSTPLAGRLMRIELDAGDEISAGETLLAVVEATDPALLDPRALAEAEARVKAAEAKLKQADPARQRAKTEMQYAETELGRVRALHAKNAASKQELDQKERLFQASEQDYRAASFAEEIARFELELSQAALVQTRPNGGGSVEERRFEIHAPITGRVLRVFEESATVVAAGARLLEVGNTADLEIEVDVLSSDAVNIKPGAPVLLEQWGGETPLRGTVRLVEPSGFTKVSALGVEEQRVNVIIDFVDPPQQRPTLGDGFRVEARIIVWERADVLKVPTSALFRHGDDWAVFVVADGRAVRRPVKTGRRNGLEAEVLDGLASGTPVIIHPSDKVEDGVAVVVREQPK